MDTSIQKLLLLYSSLVLINTLMSAALWYERRDPLTRAQFFVWASTLIGFVAQGVFAQGDFVITLGYSFVFLVSIAIAHVISLAMKVVVPWRLFGIIMGISYVISLITYLAHRPFFAVGLPVAIGVAFPALYTSVRVIVERRKELTTAGKGLLLSVIVYGIHMLDFAILRDKPAATAAAFTAGILIIFTLSVFVPAVVVEVVTRQQARVTAEMDVARRIQMDLLPRSPKLSGFELACYMKPADEVGGDYYDVLTFGDRAWILVGDVTGHGLSAGLVMLMAQSIISSILHTQPDISPSALNVLANGVLYENLKRLNEDRMMTIVSICLKDEKRFALSGCHDNVFIYRHATGEVETIPVSQLPCGIGFMRELEELEITEDDYQLHDNDILLIITDGVTEAAEGGSYEKGLFNEERLIEFIKANADRPVEEIKAELTRLLSEFTGGIFHDDVTFLIARANPA